MPTRSKSINNIESQGKRLEEKIKAAYDEAKAAGNKTRMKQLQKRLVNVYKTWDKYALNSRGYMKTHSGYNNLVKSEAPLPREVRTDNKNAADWLGRGFARDLRNEGILAAKKDAANLLGAKVLNEG